MTPDLRSQRHKDSLRDLAEELSAMAERVYRLVEPELDDSPDNLLIDLPGDLPDESPNDFWIIDDGIDDGIDDALGSHEWAFAIDLPPARIQTLKAA